MAFENMKLREFLDELASNSPAPGGGSVAALGASMGAALVSMVASLTVGKEKYRDNWGVMEAIRVKSEDLRARFVKLMNDDTESFNVYMAAMKLPKDTDEQKEARKSAMQKAAQAATLVPLLTLEACVDMAGLAFETTLKGNPNALSDAGSAALLAFAAGLAAAYNVRINLPNVKDETFVKDVRERMSRAVDDLARLDRETRREVDKALG
jgi:glutamate formiminotransferase/formiminotetrahydrofolate cyclodeaminase